jgi:hypothetical protein
MFDLTVGIIVITEENLDLISFTLISVFVRRTQTRAVVDALD